METSGIRSTETLFRPMRPYFDPYYLYLGVAGVLAARGLQKRNSRARIVLAEIAEIEPKTRTKDSKKKIFPGGSEAHESYLQVRRFRQSSWGDQIANQT